MSLDIDWADAYEERPPEPTEADDRVRLADRLRHLRKQPDSCITRGLLLETQRRASILMCGSRADRYMQRNGVTV